MFDPSPDLCQSTGDEEDTRAEQSSGKLESSLREVQHRDIKEEDEGLWATEQGESQVPHQPQPSACSPDERDDTKASVQRGQGLQGTSDVHCTPSVVSTRIHNENVQDSIKSQELVNSSTAADQTETEQSQGSHLTAVPLDYQCCVCGKSLTSSPHLGSPAVRVQSKDADVPCAMCRKTLNASQTLTMHLNSHKSPRSCHVCGKLCSSATALTEHMSSHTGTKRHRCHVCGKECSRKGDLKIHMRIHTGEKPYCCSFCCKSFTHSGHLKKHMRSHTGERPHQCVVCGKGFLQSAHLKSHLRTHT